MQEQTRLNKYLAQCGVCSRREADKLIEQGRVLVNGIPGTTGQQVSTADRIHVNGKLLQGVESKKVLAFYKPVGVTCTEKDRHAEKIITDMIDYPVRVTYAGRLDKDSEGLLLMTNDGNLINGLMRAANFHEKEYVVKVDKEITEEFIRDMAAGVYLPELEKTTRACQVEYVGKYTFKIILTQGLNRQIRRMCKELGYQVKQLRRVRIANIELGKLKPREYRRVTDQELEMLYSKVRNQESE